MSIDAAPVRSAAGVVLGSALAAGVALGGAYWIGEHFVRDDLLGAIVIPAVVATIAAIASIAALGTRGDRWTPLRMLGAWALLVPIVAAATTALISLPTESPLYIPHAAVQTAVRSEIAVAFAALVLLRAWLRGRRRVVRAPD